MAHLIMFDFDGVVADSFEVFYAEFRAAVEELGFHKLQSRGDLLGLFEGNAFVQLVKLGFRCGA
jgi:phosphoglycolate phosphatase